MAEGLSGPSNVFRWLMHGKEILEEQGVGQELKIRGQIFGLDLQNWGFSVRLWTPGVRVFMLGLGTDFG